MLFVSYLVTGLVTSLGIQLFAIEGRLNTENMSHYLEIVEMAEVAAGRTWLISMVMVGVMFVVSVVVTYFLANALTKPIEQLGDFAKNMGDGRFETNPMTFKDIELDELNQALNKSITQLGAYDSAQKEFFQNASHELRTPLMAIKVYAEGIKYGIMKPEEASETILAETDRLSELVRDLLYMAKIDDMGRTYQINQMDLAQLLSDCLQRQQAVAQSRGIKLVGHQLEVPIPYEGVSDLISRAVDNLVSNGLRYAKTSLTITCEATAYDVVITVTDDGAGMDEAIIPHVFERFYKGVGGNTGIGLSIVKAIAQQHGGYASAQNTEQGACFTLMLPRRKNWQGERHDEPRD